MNKEKQRIAIAEACGWTDVKGTKGVHPKARFKGCGYADDWIALPNYLNDLNAMHEAEMSRVDMEDGRFIVLFREYLHTILGHDGSLAIHATGIQRAEAFLKTIGKWEDEA
jgi:hypothetical protein